MKIIHRRTQELIAEGKRGWAITPFEGNFYINLGWKYWLPNPLLPFIWFRTAVPRNHDELVIVGDGGRER